MHTKGDTDSPQEHGTADGHKVGKDTGKAGPDGQTPEQTGEEGSVTPPIAAGEPPGAEIAASRARAGKVRGRLRAEGRWGDIEPIRDDMMRQARKGKGMSKAAAQMWTYSELDRLYPPLPPEPDDPKSAVPALLPADDAQLRGLGDIPASWPPLPATATLQADLSWVQSERLYIVVNEPGGATVVHLAHAHEPAPSRAALGWLETSIRAYSKYVDVIARSLRDEEDEQEHVRRERMRIEEIRELLREMRR